MSWFSIGKPKHEGGLGVKDCGAFNVTLLRKWAWKILLENDMT